MDDDYICPECGEVPRGRPHSATGLCYPCFLQHAPGFKFVGGGGYGKQAFHDRTTAEVIRENTKDAKECGGKENVVFTGSRWV